MDEKRLLIIDRQKVRKHWGKTESEVEEFIENVKQWIETQDFPEMPTDHMIEFFLTNCKYDIEKTKSNIETYYSIRKMVPEVYENSNPRLPEMQNAWDMGCYLPLPKAQDDLYRISILKINPGCQNFNACTYFANVMNVYEVRILEDLVLSEIVILDYEHLKWSHVFQFSPLLVKKMVEISENVAKNRVKQIHVVQSPTFINILLNIGKKFMKKKMADRIMVHKNIESLCDYVELELLPSDYGGREKPLSEIIEMWQKKIAAHQDRFDFLDGI